MLALYSITAALPTIDPIENIENALTQWYQSLSDLADMLQQDPTGVARFGPWITVLINRVTQPVGYAIIVLCFFFGIFGTGATMAETKRPEAAVRLFIRTGVAATFVEKGYSFVSQILSISQSLIGEITGQSFVNITAGTAPKVPEEIKTAVHALSPIAGLGITIIGLVGSLAITVCSFVVLLTVYGRWFKVYMYMIISTIPLGTFAAKNTQQVGIQFLRNYVAVTLEGVVMIIAVWVYIQLQTYTSWMVIPDKYDPAVMSANAMVWNYLQVTIFRMLILITVIKASNQLAKEMFGV